MYRIINQGAGIAILFGSLLWACQPKSTKEDVEKWKKEIETAEKSFNDMAAKEGVAEAFLAFAADDAVLMRSNSLVLGKESIRARFEKTAPNDYQLTWKPDFIDVSASGDLAYTYGKYTYSTVDSLGNESKFDGIFHTVWKRQDDGSWKFVWD